MAETAHQNEATLAAMKAYLAALEGRPEDGLALLADKEDSDSILRRLTILLEGEQFEEAARLVRGRAPDALWCEKAVASLAAVGDFDAANELVAWAHRQKRDPLLWPLCLVALSRHRHLHTFRGWSDKKKPVLPGELTDDEARGVRASLTDLEPVLSTVKAQRRILTGVEATAVAFAMDLAHLLNDRERYKELAELLWERTPLPLNYAYAVTRKVVVPNPELPERLRKERGESFEAKRLAAFIEGVLLKKAEDAVAATEELLKEHPSADQLEQLAHLLIQLAGELPQERREAIEARAAELLGPGSRFATFREIEALLRDGRHDDAVARLEESPDRSDPTWLELLAAARAGQGRAGESLDLLIEATDVFPEPGLLRKAATVAERQDRRDQAMALWERLLHAEPDDVMARARLAHLLIDGGQYARAATEFHRLRALRPDEPAFGLNEAVSLALALRYEESLRVYDELCSVEAPPVTAVVGRAVLLKGMNRAEEAFRTLEQHRGLFWNHPRAYALCVESPWIT